MKWKIEGDDQMKKVQTYFLFFIPIFVWYIFYEKAHVSYIFILFKNVNVEKD